MSRDLESPGALVSDQNTYNYNFSNVEMEYETYRGKTCQVKYFVVCTILTKIRSFFAENEFGVVYRPSDLSTLAESVIKLDV